MILWLLVVSFFSSELILSASTELNQPLVDVGSPAYHGTFDPSSFPFDLYHFTTNSIVSFVTIKSTEFLRSVKDDDVILDIFDYLDEQSLLNLSKVAFNSKRLFRLLSAHFTRKFFNFNPKVFWMLPINVRLRFALNYLHKIETSFPGIRGNVDLSMDDLTGLILLLLHFKNPFFISPSDLNLVCRLNPPLFYELNSSLSPSSSSKKIKFSPPFHSESIWRTIIISLAIKRDAYYTIQAACKLDSNIKYWIIELYAHKIGLLETKFGGKISSKAEMILNQIVKDDPAALKSLLVHSVAQGTISTFSTFLPLWTDNLNEISSDNHIMLKIAENRLCCVEILSRPDLTPHLLASTLLRCKQVGNGVFATELLFRFPSGNFATVFDPETLEIIKRIISAQIALTRTTLDIPPNSHLQIALLLASFHFEQENVLKTFSRLIRDHVSPEVLEELLKKRSRVYYNIAKENRGGTVDKCTIS